MRLVVAVALAALLSLAPISAFAQVCVPWDAFRATAPAEITVAAIDAPAFLAAFNAEPPTSDYKADAIWAARRGAFVRIFFVIDGCVDGYVDMLATKLEHFLGDPA